MLLLSVGCAPPSGTEDSTGTTGGETDAPGTTGEPTTGPQAACEPFEPFELDVQAEPNGLYWRGDLDAVHR